MIILLSWPSKWISVKPDFWFDMICLSIANAVLFSYYWFLGVKNVFIFDFYVYAADFFKNIKLLWFYFSLNVLCMFYLHFFLLLFEICYWFLRSIWRLWISIFKQYSDMIISCCLCRKFFLKSQHLKKSLSKYHSKW